MHDFKLADMRAEHIREIAAIEAQCFGARAWSEELLRAELADENKHYKVILHQDKVIGYGGFSHIIDEGHIMNIAVASPYRRMGAGSLIMNALKEKARSLNITALTLEAGEHNRPAIDFYHRHNFKDCGIRPGYYSDKEGALILWCLLEEG
jgi:ribosomal-protein-alanine N-acetyltransferase